jgi:hypothetical protein
MPNEMTIEQAVEEARGMVLQKAGHPFRSEHRDALTTLLARIAALEAEVGRLRPLVRAMDSLLTGIAVHNDRMVGNRPTKPIQGPVIDEAYAAYRAALAGEVEGGIEQNERIGE